MNTFAELVRALRNTSGMKVEEMARRMDSHKGYASGICNGKVNPPSVALVRKIAKAFKKTLLEKGIQATDEDWVELAWASKSPALIRQRALARLVDNPLASALIARPAPPPAITPASAEPAREAV